jgi:group II intron reverse transcriptase/maturase
MKHKEVLERVYEPGRLNSAWQQVKRNAGAAGIDRMSVSGFASREEELLGLIHEKLASGTFRFKPARRVLIPKEGNKKKMRPLGIPVVIDRIVSQSANLVLEEIFDSDFAASNYGFRRGRSQQQAIRHVQMGVLEGREWGASIDLENFFGEISHTLIFRLLRKRISDERFITLIARALKAGTIISGKFEKTRKGCPQGSPVSPILSNIVLNELDWELERRGLWYCRWADDFVILLKSERAAKRVLEGIINWVESNLQLPVNKEKSCVAKMKDITFLGFQILAGKIRVSNKSRKKFKEKIRTLTLRNNPFSMYHNIQELNKYLQGWASYYKIQEFKSLFFELDGWIRSRLRSMQLKKWKKPRKFQRMMIRCGFSVEVSKRTWVNMKKWQSTARIEVRSVLNIAWFRKQGLIFLYDFI